MKHDKSARSSRRGFLWEVGAALLAAGGASAQSRRSYRLNRPYEKVLVAPLVPDVTSYEVIARGPDREQKQLGKRVPVGWCDRHGIAGSPSAMYDANAGEFWLTYRSAADGPRICELHIAKSKDGRKFMDVQVWNITCERSCLLKDPRSGKFKLYLCTTWNFGLGARKFEPPVPVGRDAAGDSWWVILKLDDVENPADFKLDTARIVLQPSAAGVDWNQVKDPYVVTIGNRYYMYYNGRGKYVQCCLATSLDGETWQRHPANPVIPQGGWHDFYTRPACIVPAGSHYLFYYEGSNREWVAPVYTMATGLAVTTDLEHIVDMTPDAPILKSPTPGPTPWGGGANFTLRYMDAVALDDRILYYYEAATEDGCNELRLTEMRLDTQTVKPKTW
jgi:hypothetical protein